MNSEQAIQVGIIGLGLMGSAIAGSLIAAGFDVVGFDTDASRVGEHIERGGTGATSAAEVAVGVDVLITSLPNSGVSREVGFGKLGIASSASPGLLWLDATTSQPEEAEALGDDLSRVGIRFMDTCVSGTSAMARQKDLVVIAGGSDDDFRDALPVLSAFSRACYHMGPVGSGARTKLIINLVLAGNRMALAEGLVVGEKIGFNGPALLEVLMDSACSSKTMMDKGPKMLSGDYSPEGQVRSGAKNSRLMIDQAERFGAPSLIAQIYLRVTEEAVAAGYGDRDTAAVIEVLRRMADLEPRG